MSFPVRRLHAIIAVGMLFVLAASCSEQVKSTAPLAKPGSAAFDAFPDSCTSLATCVGQPDVAAASFENLTVCKYYPTGTVNPPAVQVQLDVVTNVVTSSPTSLVYTVQPNTCLRLWWTGGGVTSTTDHFTLQELVPAGYTSTSQITTKVRTGTSGAAFTTSTAAGGTVVTGQTGGPNIIGVLVEFTNTPIPPEVGAIGDFVWNDVNGNGVQDSGEPGIPGVTVNLSNGATTTTDANGAYAFTNLLPGDYTVTVATPSGYVASPTGAGTSSTDSNNGAGATTTINGNTDNTIDFGFYQLGAIGDFVWNDKNANGVQDSGEPGIAGVTVTLSNGATTTTNASGAYAFANLVPGTYTVTVATPAGFVASPTGAGTPSTDSNGSGASTAIAGNTDNTIDFGFYQLGGLGDFVWNDVNSNGLQDVGEAGIAGVTVKLSTGASTTTNASGLYSFTNLTPGTYTVTVVAPSGYVASPSLVGSNGAVDSNGSGASVAIAGNTDNTIDFGYHTTGGAFTTYTQGGWGSVPHGGNPAQILASNWSAVYGSSSVIIGGGKTSKFSSALAIQNFLPAGGTPGVLSGNVTNPLSTPAGVFAGQVLALQLSVDFSNKGITKAGLGGLHLNQGKLAGATVSQVLALANSVLGGGALPSGLTLSELNTIVDNINNNYDGGTINKGYLI
ncbi:MAG: SdrD B-like domain-containing protein [bacterium]